MRPVPRLLPPGVSAPQASVGPQLQTPKVEFVVPSVPSAGVGAGAPPAEDVASLDGVL